MTGEKGPLKSPPRFHSLRSGRRPPRELDACGAAEALTETDVTIDFAQRVC